MHGGRRVYATFPVSPSPHWPQLHPRHRTYNPGVDVADHCLKRSNGLTGVVVSGMTIESASFEGILVRNASSVTISNNRIINNDMALNTTSAPFACAGLTAAAPYELNEEADCGQGLHLIAVDHSTVVNNLVQNNAGGILISDETGASHDNLVASNNVSGNTFAGGVTLLSSAPYSASTLTAPAGVYP